MARSKQYFSAAKKAAAAVYGAYQLSGRSKRASTQRTRTKNPIRKQAKRSSRRVKNRKASLSIRHKRKHVYVSSKLRKKIKKVIKGSENRGTYITTRQGSIGVVTTSGSTIDYISTAQGGYTTSLYAAKIPTVLGTNCRWLWSQPMDAFNTTDPGLDWQFFTPMKFVDAASVLWNQKSITGIYSLQTGNLNTAHVKSTGAQVVGAPANMNIVGLKLHIINSYVKMILKNSTQRAFTIDCYKCTPSTAYPSSLPMKAFKDAINEEHDGANTNAMNVFGRLSDDVDDYFVNPAVQPNMFNSFNSQWKYTRVTIRIQPGETTTLNFQGPKDYVLDYDKLKFGEDDKQHFATKKTTMACMFAVKPDLVFATEGLDPAEQGAAGRWIQSVAGKDHLIDPITMEWEEHFVLGMPDIVGFQNQASSTAQQPLNNRLPRRAFGNFVNVHKALNNPVYEQTNEEQPGTKISASVTL